MLGLETSGQRAQHRGSWQERTSRSASLMKGVCASEERTTSFVKFSAGYTCGFYVGAAWMYLFGDMIIEAVREMLTDRQPPYRDLLSARPDSASNEPVRYS